MLFQFQFEPPATIDAEQVRQLFCAAAFWAQDRTALQWAIAMLNSHPVLTVRQADRLIGFARATSDGVFRANIWDVVVHPDFQGMGLGRQLIERLLEHPCLQVERIYLMTTDQQGFYERLGFAANPTTTMLFSHFALEKGNANQSNAVIGSFANDQPVDPPTQTRSRFRRTDAGRSAVLGGSPGQAQ